MLVLGGKLRGMGNPDQSPAGLDLAVAVEPAACIMHRDASTEASMSLSGCGEISFLGFSLLELQLTSRNNSRRRPVLSSPACSTEGRSS
ncbi:unnamed protein product [Arctogadus glacialis]